MHARFTNLSTCLVKFSFWFASRFEAPCVQSLWPSVCASRHASHHVAVKHKGRLVHTLPGLEFIFHSLMLVFALPCRLRNGHHGHLFTCLLYTFVNKSLYYRAFICQYTHKSSAFILLLYSKWYKWASMVFFHFSFGKRGGEYGRTPMGCRLLHKER